MAKPLLSKKKEQAAQQALARAMELHRMGLLDGAEQHYRQVLELKPRQVEAQHLLGVLCAQRGQLAEALELVGTAARAHPPSPVVLSDYGLVLQKLDRNEEALAAFDRALALKPDHAPALSNRGNALSRLGRFEAAVASYDGAIRIRPDYAEALGNRGHALAALGRYEEALAGYQQALALKPHDADMQFALGNALVALGRYEEALARYDQVLTIQPENAEALANRGNALLQLKQHDSAVASYERALALRPDHAATLNNLGTALKGLKQHDAALARYDQAIAIAPRSADALYNRANLLKEMKRYDEAFAGYEAARAVAPDHGDAYALVDAAAAVCAWERVEPLTDELAARIAAGLPYTPFGLLGLRDDPALHLTCATSYIRDRIPHPIPATTTRVAARRERLRVAYLSGDLQEHATAHLMAGLFELHDRARFEIVGVSFGTDDGSAMRRRLVQAFDEFYDVAAMSDRAAGALLDRLGIDIAVDLKGYTQGCRPELLARRIAPVQVNYLGYPGTMGADFIDYVIADAVTLPFDQQPFYREKIVHLPGCYQVNDRQRAIAEATPTRAQAGLPADAFVFCCFNNSYKITRVVFEVWMRLLQAVPGSVLWLLGDNAGAMANLRGAAQARGVDPARLVFAERQKPDAHLARHRLADLFLDTLPYNAHTTASDALWAGLPVLTCRGRAFAGRVAASALDAAGMAALVTESLGEYEEAARALAHDSDRLRALRARLGENRDTHPLFDTERFRRHIESAYGRMWEIALRGEAPQGFVVDTIEQ